MKVVYLHSFTFMVILLTVHCREAEMCNITQCTCQPYIYHNYWQINCNTPGSFDVKELTQQLQGYKVGSLVLSNANLSSLPVGSFDAFQDLYVLDLSHNHLTSLPVNSFANLRSLRILNVSFNHLSDLPDGLIDNNKELEIFDASHNTISYIDTKVFHHGLYRLVNVNLSFNSLSYFELWPYVLNQEVEVNLSHNLINTFTNNINWQYNLTDIDGIRRSVDLQYNKLQHWVEDDLQKYHKLVPFHIYNLINYNLDFRHNNWICDCQFYKLLSKISESYLWKELPDIPCSEPYHLRGRSLRNLELHELVCNVTDLCPNGCICQYVPADGDVKIFCEGRSFTKLPFDLPQGNLSLYFANNSISVIDRRSYLQNISTMDISNCSLSFIHAEALTQLENPAFQRLNIENNFLQFLPKTIEQFKLSSIILKNNPLICQCNNSWLPDWVRLYSENVTEENQLKCSVDGKYQKLVDVTSIGLHCGPAEAIGVAVSLGIVLLVIASSILAVCKWKEECKTLLFAITGMHPADKCAADVMSSKPFDVYISCDRTASAVRVWVRQTLLPVLEGAGYSVFVPDRDELAAVERADSILDNLRNCKRFIAILSSGYFNESEWSLFEFDQAHSTMVEDNEGKLIFIAYEHVPNDVISSEVIKGYVKQKKVLYPREKLFSAKLKYHMAPIGKRDMQQSSYHQLESNFHDLF